MGDKAGQVVGPKSVCRSRCLVSVILHRCCFKISL